MKKTILFLLCVLCSGTIFLSCGCEKKYALTDFVSEYRSDIFIGTNGKYTVFATSSVREYPYKTDGIISDLSNLFEVTLAAPDNTKTYTISFTIDKHQYTEDLSFDSVLSVHKWSQTIPLPQENEISFQISSGDKDFQPIIVQTQSVKNKSVLSLHELLDKIFEQKRELIDSLTDKNHFNGEIYVRLLYEDNLCYYYIGITDCSGSTTSMLADAESGKIIAEKY